MNGTAQRGQVDIDRREHAKFNLESVANVHADRVLYLRAVIDNQARLIDLQMERINLLEAAAAPLGPLGQARLRRSAWWVRAGRRIAAAVRA